MFRRISRALAAGRQAAAARDAVSGAEPTQVANPVSWALIHFGDARDLVPRLAAHRAFCLRRAVRCLVVSDDIPQLCVTSREVRFEFVPWPARSALSIPGGHVAAVDHSFRRLGRAFDFWQVVGCDWEGERAQDLLALAPGWAHPAILAARSGAGNASQSRGLMVASSDR
ncbi:hypothetical protein [Tabrizicola sp.]|uniref:hypothetical protein n=1 Tax=Tabrizicola sp. TaxID=2005166 RepID=UPI002733B7F6|nr:hypothetical protein [Tabrizicola sp.]MDP3195604.1 hypothetical protein [Tabrizicola sp.]